jgi:hypothetical protein
VLSVICLSHEGVTRSHNNDYPELLCRLFPISNVIYLDCATDAEVRPCTVIKLWSNEEPCSGAARAGGVGYVGWCIVWEECWRDEGGVGRTCGRDVVCACGMLVESRGKGVVGGGVYGSLSSTMTELGGVPVRRHEAHSQRTKWLYGWVMDVYGGWCGVYLTPLGGW